MNISDKLQHLRQQHGLSQEELARRLHVARQTVSKWETNQALPALPNLTDLCDLYGISLDHLVRNDDCTPATSHPFQEQNALTSFILRAKRSTYAAHAKESLSTRPGSHDFAFEDGDWRYQDSYFGSSNFSGEETVWHNGLPIWSMNYAGRVIAEPFSGDFLKEALLLGTEKQPYRGPQIHQHGDWTYCCRSTGNFSWFSGAEAIYHRSNLVYELRFHGTALK